MPAHRRETWDRKIKLRYTWREEKCERPGENKNALLLTVVEVLLLKYGQEVKEEDMACCLVEPFHRSMVSVGFEGPKPAAHLLFSITRLLVRCATIAPCRKSSVGAN